MLSTTTVRLIAEILGDRYTLRGIVEFLASFIAFDRGLTASATGCAFDMRDAAVNVFTQVLRDMLTRFDRWCASANSTVIDKPGLQSEVQIRLPPCFRSVAAGLMVIGVR